MEEKEIKEVKLPKKKNGGLIAIIVIMALVIVGLVGYICYDNGIIFESEKQEVSEKNEDKESVSEEKEQVLDVNSRLVQNLYNKVVSMDGSFKYWMYDDYLLANNTNDYFVDKSDVNTKMNILGNSLNEKKAVFIDCNGLIPDTIKINDSDYKSVCYARSSGAYGYKPISYDKTYVESMYKDLFGNSAVLDTSIDIRVDRFALEMYHYVASIDKYVLYVVESGGTAAVSYSGIVTKAVKFGDKLKITEKSTVESPEGTVVSNYVYTFKLEDDGMYSFVSRVKEN